MENQDDNQHEHWGDKQIALNISSPIENAGKISPQLHDITIDNMRAVKSITHESKQKTIFPVNS